MAKRGILVLILCSLITACGGGSRAPVFDRSIENTQAPKPNTYVVRKGDTLYSIAFRLGMDYKVLARLNNIASNYKIYQGQRLLLKPPTLATNSSMVTDKSIRSTPSKKYTQSPATPAVKNKIPPKVAEKKPNHQPKAVSRVSSTNKQTQPKFSWQPMKGAIKWHWPATGKVIKVFKTQGTEHKGINISGSLGAPVKVSAQGRVVYVGNGLLGYGNLVIVEHNQHFLSAYAHNSRVFVKENDMVTAGQKIAEMGRAGTNRVMLHFEIRRDGKPMNPLHYLPKR